MKMASDPADVLARGAHEIYACELPETVRDEAIRSLLNVVGTAIGASQSAGVRAIVASAETPTGGTGRVLGRNERVDLAAAAAATATAAHMEDFDDGHDKLRTHPGASALGAVLPLAMAAGSDGSSALKAFAISCEAQFRIASAIMPEHYESGRHTTGTAGVFGSALAAGCLLGLGPAELRMAVELAANQACGIRAGFGTMVKPLNAGKAAANGLLSALWVQAGLTTVRAELAGANGYLAAFGEHRRAVDAFEGIGKRWEIFNNTYKPYPCGRVVHPIIDAGLSLRERIGADREVASIAIHCHPLVLDLTGAHHPATGLESKFSAVHGLAVALVRGRASVTEFSDEATCDESIEAIRARTQLIPRPNDGLGTHDVTVEIILADGSTHTEHVVAARGTLERPMSLDDIEVKARGLIEPVLPGQVANIVDYVKRIDDRASIVELADLTSSPAPTQARAGQ